MRKLLHYILIMALLLTGVCPARGGEIVLPAPGMMVLPSVPVDPATLMGMKIYPGDPLRMDFIVDHGDQRISDAFEGECRRLIGYFLASFTVPEDEMWVNLSPYEPDRIVARVLGGTALGRDMLAQDYLLKQLSASVMSPDTALGAQFWKKVYALAQEKFGTTDIAPDTFNKVWIVPQDAAVLIRGDRVLVTRSHLKVMLDTDYFATLNNAMPVGGHAAPVINGQGNYVFPGPHPDTVSQQAMREIILPALEKEINDGMTFAPLRQIYKAMILATWYKRHLKSSLLTTAYAGKNRIGGLAGPSGGEDPQQLWQRYVAAFNKGVVNLVREESDPVTGEMMPRKYFTGGLVGIRGPIAEEMSVSPEFAAHAAGRQYSAIKLRLRPEAPGGGSAALPPEAAARDHLWAISDAEQAAIIEEQKRDVLAHYPERPIVSLLDALGVHAPQDLPAAYVTGVTDHGGDRVYHIDLPPEFPASGLPEGFRIFYTDPAALFQGYSGKSLDFFFNDQALLTAVIPRFAPGEVPASPTIAFWPLTPFYVASPQPGGKGSFLQWQKIWYWHNHEMKKVVDYLKARGPVLVKEPTTRDVFGRFFLTADQARARENYIDGLSLNDMVDDPDISKGQKGVVQGVFPRFPTVYLLKGVVNVGADADYMNGLLYGPGAAAEKGKNVLVIGPGSGVDTYLSWRRSQRKVHAIGINPFEVANVRAMAGTLGFPVEARVNDGLTGPDGSFVFPGRTFQIVRWNMPYIELDPNSEVERKFNGTLQGRHDGDPRGETLIRFVRDLPLALDPNDNIVEIWNKKKAWSGGRDFVKDQFELGGFVLVSDAPDPRSRVWNSPYRVYRFKMSPALAATVRGESPVRIAAHRKSLAERWRVLIAKTRLLMPYSGGKRQGNAAMRAETAHLDLIKDLLADRGDLIIPADGISELDGYTARLSSGYVYPSGAVWAKILVVDDAGRDLHSRIEMKIDMKKKYVYTELFFPKFPGNDGRGRALLKALYRLFPGFYAFVSLPGEKMRKAISALKNDGITSDINVAAGGSGAPNPIDLLASEDRAGVRAQLIRGDKAYDGVFGSSLSEVSRLLKAKNIPGQMYSRTMLGAIAYAKGREMSIPRPDETFDPAQGRSGDTPAGVEHPRAWGAAAKAIREKSSLILTSDRWEGNELLYEIKNGAANTLVSISNLEFLLGLMVSDADREEAREDFRRMIMHLELLVSFLNEVAGSGEVSAGLREDIRAQALATESNSSIPPILGQALRRDLHPEIATLRGPSRRLLEMAQHDYQGLADDITALQCRVFPDAAQESRQDRAVAPGGIDLNARGLTIGEEGVSPAFAMARSDRILRTGDFKGLHPLILSILPVTDLTSLLQ